MIGLVLAAGAGTRLGPETAELPKTLLGVDGDRTILDVALGNFRHVGLQHVVVVTGYAHDRLAERVPALERRHGLSVELLYNPRALDWNNAYSLWCAREHFGRGVLLANGDTVHPSSVEQALLEARDSADLVLALDQHKKLGEEEMKVHVTEDGYLVNYGSSFVMAMRFTDDAPEAWAFVTYGQSDDPRSPWHIDQTEAFSHKEWRQALFTEEAIDEEAALDIVQYAMLRLAEKYGHRPAAELPLLFHRIMQNAIRDWFRRQKVRSLWTTLLSSLAPGREEDEQDALESLVAGSGSSAEEAPPEQLARAQVLEIIEQELRRLPERQRQAFILRYWEELDVAETAQAMGCSEGSVKTHCSRAAHALADALKARGITL